MELKGKKIYFLGDSITEGVGASDTEHCYVSVFGKLSGAVVKNYGISATRIACQTENLTTKEPDLSFVNRADSMDSDADVVVVFGGTNDFGHGDAELGTFESRDPYTFYGAMHVLCEKLIHRFPNADILFMTPLHRCSENEALKENGLPEETNLAGYVSIIREVAEFYGLPVLDLFSTSGLQPKVDIIKETYMPDGLHPSDAGALRIALRLMGFLQTL